MKIQERHDRMPPSFMAVFADGSVVQDVQTITPRVMKWSDEGVWILDLRSCLSFWRAKANALGIETVALLRKVLQCQFSAGCVDQISIGETAGYQAVLADSPWQAVLFLNYAKERNLGGLINFVSPFADGFRRELSWNAWWKTAVSIVDHFEATKRSHFSRLAFQSQCEQMQRAIKRLGVSDPWNLKQAESLAVGRRFGATLRDLWEWTWDGNNSPCPEGGRDVSRTGPARKDLKLSLQNQEIIRFAQDAPLSQNPISRQRLDGEYLFASGFPWQNFLLKEIPMVTRYLDDPLLEWDFLEPLLQEDLCRICDLDSWDAREGVMRLEWRVVSYDMTVLNIPVCFRHPHSLASERNRSFTTTTLQAYYSFCQTVRATATVCEKEGSLTPPSPIVSWQLMVSERLRLSDKIKDLFGASDVDSSDLISLENRLPIALIEYDISSDWTPEDSYCLSQKKNTSSNQIQDRSAQSLCALACNRPLFLYPKPIFFDSQGESVALRFLERIMTKWWSVANKQSIQRDYYQLMGRDRRLMWVFKDLCGNWYIHGIFA